MNSRSGYAPRLLEQPDPDALIEQLTFAPRVTVIVPVYNGGIAVANSLIEIAQNTPDDCRIFFADDGSTDGNVLRVLERLKSDPRIHVTHRPENIGYTCNVNAAIEEADRDDILLLNSDARPGPMYVQRMRWTLYGAENIGTVSCVSDNAATHSLPFPGAHYGVDWASVARAFATEMRQWAMVIPAAHGFCLMIKRKVFDDIGVFDEKAFPRGYNEEIDFGLRAARAGWVNVVTPRVMVRHLRSRSFSLEERTQLIAQTRQVIEQRHPGWHNQIEDWLYSPQWNEIIANAARIRRSIRQRNPQVSRGFGSETYHDAVQSFLTHGAELAEIEPDQPDLMRIIRLLGVPAR